MDVVNEYSEDFADPQATHYSHEEAMGWRLPRDPEHEETQRKFIARIPSDDTTNRSGHTQYKDANTDVIGWVAERASSRPLRSFLADIVDAAGLEGAFHITTDREGFPTLDGGACLTARDLARYFSIFVRRGRGVGGESVGSAAFIEQTLLSGVPMTLPYEGIRYSNHTMISGHALGHGGWGGQYAVANLDTGTIGVFFSVIENHTRPIAITWAPSSACSSLLRKWSRNAPPEFFHLLFAQLSVTSQASQDCLFRSPELSARRLVGLIGSATARGTYLHVSFIPEWRDSPEPTGEDARGIPDRDRPSALLIPVVRGCHLGWSCDQSEGSRPKRCPRAAGDRL